MLLTPIAQNKVDKNDIEQVQLQKQELLLKAEELIKKAEELKEAANKL